MMMTRRSTVGMSLAAALGLLTGAAPLPETFVFGAAGRVTVYRPAGAVQQVVLFVSGDGGWNLGVIGMAERLRDLGALVVGIDMRTFQRNLEASRSTCAYPAGDLEELSRAVQVKLGLPAYRPPILVGYSSGATLVYGVLAQAPVESFAGAISLGFCPDIEMARPLCRGRALASRRRAPKIGSDLEPVPDLGRPWHVLQGDIDQVCSPPATRSFVEKVGGGHLVWLPRVGHGFSVTRNWEPQYVEAYRAIASAPPSEPPAPAPGAPDLPLVEVQAGGPGDVLAVLLSGDGGWAEIDRQLAAAFAARGVSVVGWNSLRYYWTPRTPEGAAADLDSVLRHYLASWKRSRALVVGYSFGADVAPFLIARLPEATRARISGLGLVGLSGTASFAFHVTSWFGGGGEPQRRTVAEVQRLAGLRVVCVRGTDETDSACLALPPHAARAVVVPGGHHFGGDYARLAGALLDALAPADRER